MFHTVVIKQAAKNLYSGVRTKFCQVSELSTSVKNMKYETLSVTVPKPFVYHVELNRPEKMNAQSSTMVNEIGKCFQELGSDAECRAIVLSGAGKIFCAGIDFKSLMENAPKLAEAEDLARKAKIMYDEITNYQKSITALELCPKPVIAAVHSACIGAGVDLISAADIRFSSKDAWFQVKEINLGMAADVGTLQRLPKIVGNQSLVRELCFTGRKFDSAEALSCGFLSRVFSDRQSCIDGAVKIAEELASKSPVAMQGTKKSLVYARDHTVQEGLEQIAVWNQFMLQSDDFTTAVTALIAKDDEVVFSKL